MHLDQLNEIGMYAEAHMAELGNKSQITQEHEVHI
jgi:hypothetical protein